MRSGVVLMPWCVLEQDILLPESTGNTQEKENPSLVFSGDREIPTRGSTVPVGNEASPSFPLERWTRGLGFPGSTVHQ